MSNLYADRHLPGRLLMEGKFDAACEVCKEQDRQGVLDELEAANWAIALMNLESFRQASEILHRLIKANPDVSSNHVKQAICQWFMDDPESALMSWTTALSCKYQSLGGGIEVAAMLYYASNKSGNFKSERKALSRLKKLWVPGMPWPVPISGYILDNLDSQELIRLAEDNIAAINERHLCQGYFWLGFKQQKQGELDEARTLFEKSSRIGGASVLEAERYLAKWELSHS